MKYLLLEDGKTEIDANKVEELYRPYYVYTKKKKFPKGISSNELSNAVEKIKADPNAFIGLGISFNEKGFDQEAGNAITRTDPKFSPIRMEENIFQCDKDIQYIISTNKIIYLINNCTSHNFADIVRYDFAQYSDGRWVFFLITYHESHMPTRIPSE